MKDLIVIDLSNIIYWVILIYLTYNIFIFFADVITEVYDLQDLKRKPISILNPFRGYKNCDFGGRYFFIFLFTLVISIMLNQLFEYLKNYKYYI